jgi:hypothetical protein
MQASFVNSWHDQQRIPTPAWVPATVSWHCVYTMMANVSAASLPMLNVDLEFWMPSVLGVPGLGAAIAVFQLRCIGE